MSFQKHYVRYAPVWIMIVAIAIMFAPFSIRRANTAELPLSPEEREEPQRVSGEMRESAE